MSEDRESGIFQNVKYSVFGLGNKTYDHFNEMGIQIDKQMEKLGATRIHELGLGDDDVNIENDFLLWKKELLSAICKDFNLGLPTLGSTEVKRRQHMIEYEKEDPKLLNLDVNSILRWRQTDEAKHGTVDVKNPFLAKIVSSRELHKNSGRSCLHVELDSHGTLLSYQHGDHLGIFPENDPTLVHKLCALLKVDPNKVISIHPIEDKSGLQPLVGPCTVKAALGQFYDITSPCKRAQLRVFAQYANDEEEKKKLLKLASEDEVHQEEYNNYILKQIRSVIQILKEFKSIQVPLEHFLEVTPRMQPRYYSISSSPNKFTNTVHLTAVVLEYESPIKRKIKGVATSWLSKNRPDLEKSLTPKIPAFIRKSNFKLPPSVSTPIIMVGPGTGLAPFRGFLQECEYRRSLPSNKDVPKGEVMLFFGCRHKDQDYIYQEELENHLKEGVLTDLIVAFSRMEEKKVYVQHKLKEENIAKKLWNLLENGAYFYVCGDARYMANDVQNALCEIIMEQGGKTKEEAEKYISLLQTNRRYIADVWS